MTIPQQNYRRRFYIPAEGRVRRALLASSLTERVIFAVFALLLIAVSFILFWKVNAASMVEVPARGGVLAEGITGTPRFINPLLANSDADRDLTSLIYAGLLKPTPSGALRKELAASYDVSDDGRTYTFTLKDDIYFHDGEPITSDDVVFTINMAKDPDLKSPARSNWTGVGVEKLGPKQVRFRLDEPYSPFLENATIGILPKHIWKNATSEEFTFSRYNRHPIGAGAFEVSDVALNSAGLPTSYRLKAFDHYTLGGPYISTLLIKLYTNESELVEAYANGDIDALAGVSPEYAKGLAEDGARVETAVLPRVFGVFFNHNNASIFTSDAVRKALNAATPREEIAGTVLSGYATPIKEPIPPGLLGSAASSSPEASGAAVSPEGDHDDEEGSGVAEAREILEASGWTRTNGIYTKGGSELSFSISTSDTPELRRTAEALKNAWEAVGAEVNVKVFEIGDLNQNIIRPRKYDALLFGEIIGRDMDLYPFWHSSQRNDPGLNVAMYANIEADALLEEAREVLDRDERLDKYAELTDIITEETPAIFTYSPEFIYIVPDRLENLALGNIATHGERFMTVHRWYLETESVWKVFNKKSDVKVLQTQ